MSRFIEVLADIAIDIRRQAHKLSKELTLKEVLADPVWIDIFADFCRKEQSHHKSGLSVSSRGLGEQCGLAP